MFKSLTVLVSVAFLFSFLVACGGGGSSGGAAPPPPPPPPPVTELTWDQGNWDELNWQ